MVLFLFLIELQYGLVAPCHDFQLCLVLNLGLPCQVSRALHRLGGPSRQNHTMLGPAYPQTLALYIQGLGDSEGNFYWKEKLTQNCLFWGLQGPFCTQRSMALAAPMNCIRQPSRISCKRGHLHLQQVIPLFKIHLRLGKNNLLSPNVPPFPRKERTLAWEKFGFRFQS